MEETGQIDYESQFTGELWYPYLSAFSKEIDVSILTWFGIGCLVIGFFVHLLLQWIFK